MELTLRHGSIQATVVSHGGELVSLTDGDGTEYIWSGDPKYWSGRNPILFPVVGALKDDKVLFGDVLCQMPRHGFAQKSEFSLADHGDDFVVFQLRESDATLQQFPFPFDLRVRHQLLDNGFYTEYTVSDPGAGPLPFCIGGHPAFRCPLRPGETFQQYRLVFDCPETVSAIHPNSIGLLCLDHSECTLDNADTIPLDYTLFDRVDTLIFNDLRSTGVSLLSPAGRGVHMDFSGFPTIAFWTMPHANAPYICLEPWQGRAAYVTESGQFRDKPNSVILHPGEARTLRYTVTLI